MILVDPDLDPDSGPLASKSKRAPSTRSTPTDRHARVPSVRALSRFLREAQAAVRLRGQVSVLLTTDRNIRRLNRKFRGKDKSTDVLSFPALAAEKREVAGDLAVSVPTALRQAGQQGHMPSTEIKVLILHGLLHLAGFDHERDHGEMARRERLLRGRLGLPQGLIERTAHSNLAAREYGKDGALENSSNGRASRNAGRLRQAQGRLSSARVAKNVTRSSQDHRPLGAKSATRSAQDDGRARGRKR